MAWKEGSPRGAEILGPRVPCNARGDPPHRRNTTLMADRRLSKRANVDVRCYLGNTQTSLSPTC